MLFKVCSFWFDNWEEIENVDETLGVLTVPRNPGFCWFIKCEEIDDPFEIGLDDFWIILKQVNITFKKRKKENK